MRSLSVVTAIIFCLMCGCGRFAEPLTPEMVAPKTVESLVVTAVPTGMLFTWSTPKNDRRGKELKFIDGYSVERKELVDRGDETNPDVEWFQLAFVPDTSITVREELRAKAREEGKLGRRLKAPEELTHFSFLDPTAQVGRRYLYQIVPQNQDGVEGVVKTTVKVTFAGEQSDITLLDSDDLEEEAEDASTKNTGKGK